MSRPTFYVSYLWYISSHVLHRPPFSSISSNISPALFIKLSLIRWYFLIWLVQAMNEIRRYYSTIFLSNPKVGTFHEIVGVSLPCFIIIFIQLTRTCGISNRSLACQVCNLLTFSSVSCFDWYGCPQLPSRYSLLLCLTGQLSNDAYRSVILLLSLPYKSISTTVRHSLAQTVC